MFYIRALGYNKIMMILYNNQINNKQFKSKVYKDLIVLIGIKKILHHKLMKFIKK